MTDMIPAVFFGIAWLLQGIWYEWSGSKSSWTGFSFGAAFGHLIWWISLL